MAKNQNNNVAPATQKTEPEAKKDALATALAQIEKQFGKGAVMKLGDNASMQVDAISTGSLGLDLALGVGGVPRGRIIEVYGPESSGKTTLALHILAEAQKKGGEVAFIDVEHALDPTYTESTTMASMAPERTSASQISMACSPVSGWLTSRLLMSTPSASA